MTYRDPPPSPSPRLWECDWLVLDLERITAMQKATDEDDWTGVLVSVLDQDDVFAIEDPRQAAELVAAWKAYRGCGPVEVYTRAPRTGYTDELGAFHPPPGDDCYDRHADCCASCDAERRRAS